MKIIALEEIKEILPSIDPLPAIEAGFVAYSAGRAVVPPVGELLLERGEVHIKYGYIQDEAYYVVKIASGFYGNPALGLPSSNGLMLLFEQRTGALRCILLDEGHLTDVRTAVAGAIAAKYLAPGQVRRIGIVGTGIQARLQLRFLHGLTPCRDVLVWGRGRRQLDAYTADLADLDFQIETTLEAADVLRRCNLVVTTTPSAEPLLFASNLRPGTHITAVGSDTPHKQELDAAILGQADVVVADSISQCLVRGEIHRALRAGLIAEADLVELGGIISGQTPGRTSDRQITVADLTGVAVQDMNIAEAVYLWSVDSGQ
ncbi:MAG: ornithine cyclodeaminase family protein [Chloroflexota bacterium]|nr:MAG: ornithine cyclodeaminase family protein [Chloroflexota bacterium]